MDCESENLRIITFDGRPQNKFQLWALCMQELLEGKDIAIIVLGKVKAEPFVEASQNQLHKESFLKTTKGHSILISALVDFFARSAVRRLTKIKV